MTERPIPTLTPVEARVLGVLVEKQLTVPDTYPLTLNALLAGCNQRTSREPVMTLGEGEVQDALESLRRRSLVIESSGSRVMRYAHNVRPVLGVPAESVALLATLMLRGPQTSAELRANTERLQRFSDASALEAFLEELATWAAGPLVARLPRQAGAREQRWAHQLCGPRPPAPEPSTAAAAADADARVEVPVGHTHPDPGLESRIEALERRVAQLDAAMRSLCAALGVEPPDPAQAGQVIQSS
jgi:uncharacterized protein YceH (UPF0502 family)